jgi:membrane protein DedA with SNARE-associated domain
VLVGSVTSTITEWITGLVGDHAVYAVFILMLVDAVFPAASELVMLYGGAVASGALTSGSVVLFGERISEPAWAFVTIALSGTIGYTLGSLAGWAIGAYGGRPLLERHGRWFHLSGEKLHRADRWFQHYGAWAVFLGRITPVIRSFISIPAGVFRDPLVRYTLLTLVGSALWAFALAGAGWGIGASWERFHHEFRYAEIAVVALIGLALAYLAARWLRRRRGPAATGR